MNARTGFGIMWIVAGGALRVAGISRPAFVMPDAIYAAPGIECNVYWGEVLDSVRPDRYAVEARSRVGRCENERWTWTPDAKDAGRRETVVFNAWSDDGLACACTATVHVAGTPADASRRVTCAILGDSLTNARYQDRIMKVMREAGWKGFEPVGSRSGPSSEKVGVKREGEAPHDGYGGFTPKDFLARYSLSMEEIDNLQSKAEREQLESFGVKIPPGNEWRRNLLKSPLVKIVEGRKVVDVQAWLDRINGGQAPDFVLIFLGVNGTCAQRDEMIASHCDKVQVASMRELVKTLRASAPAAKIAIGTCVVGTDQDAFGKNYGCSISAVQSRKNMLYLNRRWMALVKEFNDLGDANVFIVPVGQALDPVHGYPKHNVPRSASSTAMVERSSNAFHPTLEGGKQLGDAFAAWILCNL